MSKRFPKYYMCYDATLKLATQTPPPLAKRKRREATRTASIVGQPINSHLSQPCRARIVHDPPTQTADQRRLPTQVRIRPHCCAGMGAGKGE